MSNLPPPPPPPPGHPLPSGPDLSSLSPGGPPPPGPDGSGLPLAGWGRRLAAYIIDLIIWVIALMVVIIPLEWDSEWRGGFADSLNTEWSSFRITSTAVMFVLQSLIFGGLFTGLWGRTPGKAALKSLADHLWPLWDSQNQTVHDKVIRSHVVYTGGD